MSEEMSKSTNEQNTDEKTMLVAVKSMSKEAWLLRYTLNDVKELIELAECLLDQEDVPKDIKSDFEGVLVRVRDKGEVSK